MSIEREGCKYMALDNFDSVSVGLLVVSCGNNTWGGSIHIIGSSQLKVVEALVWRSNKEDRDVSIFLLRR